MERIPENYQQLINKLALSVTMSSLRCRRSVLMNMQQLPAFNVGYEGLLERL